MKRRLLLSLPLAALGATGCASVPLGTMMRMSTFNERDFARLDPDVIRVRVTLPEGFSLNAQASTLGVRIGSAAGVHDSGFELEQEAAQAAVVADGLFARSKPGTAWTLRLAAPSKERFRELQAFVARARADEIVIRVNPRLTAAPASATTVNVWVDLLLSRAQGWFTLLDAAPVSLERIRRTDGKG